VVSRLGLVLTLTSLSMDREALAQAAPPPLSGVVVDSAGAPIGLADIIAVRRVRRTEDPHYARTDAAGRFVFSRLEPGTYTLTVRRIGFVPEQVLVVLGQGTPRSLRFVLQRMPQLLADLVADAPRLAADSLGRDAPLFQGVVVDSSGRPIADAEIEAGGSTRTTRGVTGRRSNPQGRFVFETLRPGAYFITVRRIGYAPIRAALTFEAGTPRTIRFEMQPMPHQLADLEVRGDGFDLRRISSRVSAGAYRGTLLTRDDLARMAPRVLGDAIGKTLTAVTRETFDEPNLGFSHLWVRVGDMERLRFTTGMRGQDCPPSISVNGRPTRAGWAINDFAPEYIEAVEIYKGSAPFPFDSDHFLSGNCGKLVVIWLRAGVDLNQALRR